MKNNQILKTVLFLLAIIPMMGMAQEFKYEPAEPEAGQEITITFTPASLMPVRFTATQMLGLSPEDLDIETNRSRGVYTLTIKPSEEATFVYFAVTMNKVPDNNNGEGYYIELFENGKPKKNANLAKAYFYQYYGNEAGIEEDKERAFKAAERELKFHPDNRTAKTTFYRLYLAQDNEKANDALTKEINSLKAKGLETEADYNFLSQLYNFAKNKEAIEKLTEEKKAKFPEGEWVASDYINDFYQEKDIEKKRKMMGEIINNVNTKANWSRNKPMLTSLQSVILRDYINAKNWEGYQDALKAYNFTLDRSKSESDLSNVIYTYNSAAWKMQEEGENLGLAKEQMREAVSYTKETWDEAVAARKSESVRNSAKNRYGVIIDTYAMVLLADNQKEEGLKYAKEVAYEIAEGKNADYNTTYARLAEGIVSNTEYKEALEAFVMDGKATSYIKEALERTYIAENGSSEGFVEHLAALEVESKKRMREELLTKLESKDAPKFDLVNLDGSKVNLEELKGKTVIVDFWATWCGPCIASFPAMQETQEKHKDNPNVKFVFINSWEQGEDKEDKVRAFIDNGKYPFDVLFDYDDKVIGSYGVSGIPTKFVIDGNGNIRFTSIGYGGNKDKAVDELSMMIEIAGEE